MKSCPRCGTSLEAVEPSASVGDLSISLYGDCWWKGCRVRLTNGELAMVHLLASNPGQFFTAEAMNNVRGSEDCLGNGAQVLMSRIRSAFREVDPDFDAIETDRTKRSRGYRWIGTQGP